MCFPDNSKVPPRIDPDEGSRIDKVLILSPDMLSSTCCQCLWWDTVCELFDLKLLEDLLPSFALGNPLAAAPADHGSNMLRTVC